MGSWLLESKSALVGKGQHDKQFFSSPHLRFRSLGLGGPSKPRELPHMLQPRTDIATRHRDDSDKGTRDRRVTTADNHSSTRFRSFRALDHHPTRSHPLCTKDRMSPPPHVVHGGPTLPRLMNAIPHANRARRCMYRNASVDIWWPTVPWGLCTPTMAQPCSRHPRPTSRILSPGFSGHLPRSFLSAFEG